MGDLEDTGLEQPLGVVVRWPIVKQKQDKVKGKVDENTNIVNGFHLQEAAAIDNCWMLSDAIWATGLIQKD